ncbi:hypothetical protein EMCRGX_G004203 [Ephydatia muelleri]
MFLNDCIGWFETHRIFSEHSSRMSVVPSRPEQGTCCPAVIDQLFCAKQNITEQPKSLDAMLGKARYYLSRHNFSHALDLLNQAVASYPGCVPALLDKMKVQLALQYWEQAMETTQRCLLTTQDHHALGLFNQAVASHPALLGKIRIQLVLQNTLCTSIKGQTPNKLFNLLAIWSYTSSNLYVLDCKERC